MLIVSSALAMIPGDGDSQFTKPVGGADLGAVSCTCPADFDFSGVVDGADLGQLLAAWGGPIGDLNGSGSTDGADLGMLLSQWGSCAVVPANDLCANAAPIGEGSHSFCTLGALSQGPAYPVGSPCIQFGFDSIDRDIWYRYTADAFGSVVVSTCGTTWDTRLAAYTNAFPSPNTSCPAEGFSFTAVIACNDDFAGCGLASRIEFNVIPGQQYLIRVGGYVGYSGVGTLNVEFTSEGQTCEDAIDLGFTSTNGEYVLGTTLDNDPAADVSPCGLGDTVPEWYKFTASCPLLISPTITITTCHEYTDFDTVISVWRAGSGGQCLGEFVVCNDDSTAPGCQLNGLNRLSKVTFPADNKEVFYLRVSGYQGAVGNFHLQVHPGCN